MLLDVKTQCPKCREITSLAISISEDPDIHFATSSCMHCHSSFITITLEDFSALVQGEDNEQTIIPASHIIAALEARKSRKVESLALSPELGIFHRPFTLPASPKGISDEEISSKNTIHCGEALFRPDGSRRETKDLVQHMGWRGAWLEELQWEITQRMHGPIPMTTPPRVFISYRWKDEDGDPWVERLARKLQSRGYSVVYDLDLGPSDNPNVPELVSQIADCRYFLAILDAGYTERIGEAESSSIQDGWVFDEFNTACRFSEAKSLHIIGLLREGELLSRGFKFAVPQQLGNAVDVRTTTKLLNFLDDVFPSLGHSAPIDKVERAKQTIADAHQQALTNRIDSAFKKAKQVREELADCPDGDIESIRIALHLNKPQEGLQAARRCLIDMPNNIEVLLAAIQFSMQQGKARELAEYSRRVIDLQPKNDIYFSQSQFGIAFALDELERTDAAYSHMANLVQCYPQIPNYLMNYGYMLRRLRLFDEAYTVLSSAATYSPQDPDILRNCISVACELGEVKAAQSWLNVLFECAPTIAQELSSYVEYCKEKGPLQLIIPAKLPEIDKLLTCSDCNAHVIIGKNDKLLCSHCGVPRAGHAECYYCGSDGALPLGLNIGVEGLAMRCPFCHQGSLKIQIPDRDSETQAFA